MIQLTNNDAALPYFTKLNHRDRLSVVETADTMKGLVDTLHVTSTPTRPMLNGSSIQFIADQLGISKSLISQLLSIGGIRSRNVKQALAISNASINKAYYISRIKGKSFPEIETLQMAEIGRISPGNDKLTHKLKAAQMILRNVAGSKSLKFEEIDCSDAVTAPSALIQNIEKCIDMVAPNIKKVKILSEQLSYCNFLITHINDCKCLCGSDLDLSALQLKREAFIDEIASMQNQVMSEKKYTSLLISARKDLEAAICSNN